MAVDASAESKDSKQKMEWTVELGTDFPVQVGPLVRVEMPNRIRFSTGLGVMPSVYLDSINAVAVSAGWYDALTADLLTLAMENSLVWTTRVGWRPMEERGLYVQGGYNLVTLGGGLSGVELVSAVTGQSLPSDAGVGRTMNVESTAHMLNLEVGWEWTVFQNGLVRSGLGGAFTVGSNTEISPNWTPRPRIQPAVETLTSGGETYLTSVIQDYVHTVVITISAGWQI